MLAAYLCAPPLSILPGSHTHTWIIPNEKMNCSKWGKSSRNENIQSNIRLFLLYIVYLYLYLHLLFHSHTHKQRLYIFVSPCIAFCCCSLESLLINDLLCCQVSHSTTTHLRRWRRWWRKKKKTTIPKAYIVRKSHDHCIYTIHENTCHGVWSVFCWSLLILIERWSEYICMGQNMASGLAGMHSCTKSIHLSVERKLPHGTALWKHENIPYVRPINE